MFLNRHAGFDYLLSLFKGNVDHIKKMNRDRHLVIFCKDGSKFYCLFKKDFIHSFNNYAQDLIREYPDFSGFGESINTDFCLWARENNCLLLFLYEDGRLYFVHPSVVMKLSIVHVQKQVNSYIEYSSRVDKNEREYWFSVKLLDKFVVDK